MNAISGLMYCSSGTVSSWLYSGPLPHNIAHGLYLLQDRLRILGCKVGRQVLVQSLPKWHSLDRVRSFSSSSWICLVFIIAKGKEVPEGPMNRSGSRGHTVGAHQSHQQWRTISTPPFHCSGAVTVEPRTAPTPYHSFSEF